MTARPARRAFTLVELLLALAIIAVLVSLLLPAIGDARRNGRSARCFANIRQCAVGTPLYGGDFKDATWTFSWKKGQSLGAYWDLWAQPSDNEAASSQAVEIMRRRGDRPDMPRMLQWAPHPLYSRLVLSDYLGSPLPDPSAACPEDRNRLLWQSDPRGFDRGLFHPSPSEGQGPDHNSRYPYSSSYQIPISVYDRSRMAQRVTQGPASCDGFFIIPGHEFGGLRLGDVAYPAQKVHVFDRHQRHFGRKSPFFGLAGSRQPLLHFDGSVVTRKTQQANPGWQPTDPASPLPTIVTYQPQAWDPRAVTGASDQGTGVYRWTRGGLRGVDFSGAEINTGQTSP